MAEDKKLCIVVPYRNRQEHLEQFIPAITKTLNEQQIDFKIIVVEQEEGKPFNRAKLLNVGFAYTGGKFDYYCFHDVDMLPITSDYLYCDTPTHLAAEAEQFGYKLPYNEYFGGVTLFDRESFQKINGYSNEYWSWGGEDDDVFKRCEVMCILRNRKNCRYASLHHERNFDQALYTKIVERLNNFNKYVVDNRIIEGLSTLDYKLLTEETVSNNYSKIKVSI